MRRLPGFLMAILCCGCFFLFSRFGKESPRSKTIICLTYDDGLESQLAVAIPQLDSAGFKATFFLNSIEGASQSDKIGQAPEAVLRWTLAARNGHELGNHTLFHACPLALGWDKEISIEQYSLDRLMEEIEIQNRLLALIDPPTICRCYAYPCNNSIVGGVDYSETLRKRRLVTYARWGGDSSSIISNFNSLDPMKVPSWHVWTGTSLASLIAFAQRARDAEGMGVYQFHGVDGQIFSISSATHRGFLQYLKDHADEYRVLTFSEAMRIVTRE